MTLVYKCSVFVICVYLIQLMFSTYFEYITKYVIQMFNIMKFTHKVFITFSLFSFHPRKVNSSRHMTLKQSLFEVAMFITLKQCYCNKKIPVLTNLVSTLYKYIYICVCVCMYVYKAPILGKMAFNPMTPLTYNNILES